MFNAVSEIRKIFHQLPHGCKFRVPAGCVDTVSSLLLFGFRTNCRLKSLCPLPSRSSGPDWWASQRLRRQLIDVRPVFTLHPSTFLSVCGTWIYRLLHAHLPCTTLLNSEECALLENKKRRRIVLTSVNAGWVDLPSVITTTTLG